MRDRLGLGIDIIEEAIPEKSYQHWQRDSLTKPNPDTFTLGFLFVTITKI